MIRCVQLATALISLVVPMSWANDIFVARETYFAIVPDSTYRAKFQIRLSAPVISQENTESWPQHAPRPWLFYNQKSFWEIGEPSAPFSEHNFNPGFGLVFTNGESCRLTLGFEHISNGLDGDKSRSLNRVFADPSIIVWDRRVELSLRLWQYTGDTEPLNLHRYWGYVKPSIAYDSKPDSDEDGWYVRVSGHVGSDSKYYGIESTVIFPLQALSKLSGDFNPNFIINWWYGHGERMLTLDKREHLVRIGLAFNVPERDRVSIFSAEGEGM